MKHFKLILLAAVIVFASCTKKQELTSGIIAKNMDTKVKPGDDFANYVNGTWLKNTKIPADKSSYGATHILSDKSQKDVWAIIEDASKESIVLGSDKQKIGDFYRSFMDREGRDNKGIYPLGPQLQEINHITNYNDLAAYFGKANRTEMHIPFRISVEPDLKNPKAYSITTWQDGLGLPEREYYLATDAKSIEIRKKYVAYIKETLQWTEMEKPAEGAIKIMALETKLAKHQMKKEETRDIGKMYNKYATKDLNTLTPDFNWQAMLSNAGMANQEAIIVTQVEYIKSLDAIIKTTPIDTWKTYLTWSLINQSAHFLTTDLDKANFEFYGKVLSGTEKQEDDWKRAVDVINHNIGEMVGKLYVEKHFSPEAKEHVTVMVKNLLKAYAESIKHLDWMSPATKKQALYKVDKFAIKIGYPDKWRDYSELTIENNDLYGNIARATEFEYSRKLNKLGEAVDRTEWLLTPQTIRAYYNPTLNEIVFPAAILQPPFFDLNADDAVNYGAIGAIIGHEIGHGFNDQGSMFDGDGVMQNWWSPSDLAAFKSKTKSLVEQYNSYKAFPDLALNGEFTLGENIGDLGGLSITVKAYQTSLKGEEPPVMDGFTGLQRVFLGWGQVWLDKSREEALRNRIAIDPHSPPAFRINGVVRNVPEFYSAFKIKPTDALYLDPAKRVKIW